ncbi:MAG: hypothetical protein KTR27_09180 [Leptolyngbyaceae cyanobacterium MAG.088]|nr:hypothetical protein [Leptolyngbyaceae cyanobacterium MAG.088]
MNIKLAVSSAILGTLTLAMAGYAQSDTSSGSHHLSDIQAQTCPTFAGDNAIDAPPNERLAVPTRSNEVVDLTTVCYSGPSEITDPNSVGTDVSDSSNQTPQAATQFDRLPQDRVELGDRIFRTSNNEGSI